MKRLLLAGGALLSLAMLAQAQVQMPVLSSIDPTQTTAGTPTFTLSVAGSGFLSDGRSRVRWNGELLPTIYLNERLLLATVDSALI